MNQFDPSAMASADSGIFGLPFKEAESKVVLVPVPWEVTTSYGVGTSRGPEIILEASHQVDLFDFETGKSYENGFFMREIPAELSEINDKLKPAAQKLVASMGDGELSKRDQGLQQEINNACDKMTGWVYTQIKEILAFNKIPGVVGGDHSVPLGAIRAISEHLKGDFGVLHIDAHADLRKAYQGFTQSHASIMYNVMTDKLPPKKLVQVGIRDFCEEEYEFIQDNKKSIKTFFDIDLQRQLLQGKSWSDLAKKMVEELPKNVYISFDIDGLDPVLCPNTGTPVAGGLSANQAFYLFREVVESGRKIVGFDLNEVSAGAGDDYEWDANVGARMLFKLCGWASR